MTTEIIVMKSQIADAYRMNDSVADTIYFNHLCSEYIQGHASIERVRAEFKRINPIVGGYAYGPKPLNHIYGFRNVKVSY